jgi:two-component system OmpR family sensor kinase
VTSLRSRMTLSYASLVAVVLIVLAVIATRFAFSFLAEPTLNLVDRSVETAKLIVRTHPNAPSDDVYELVQRSVAQPGIVFVRREGDPRDNAPRRPVRESPASGVELSIGTMLGLYPHHVALNDGSSVFIAPDLHAIDSAVRQYLASLAVAIVVAIALAWLVGRWIAAQAIAPLIAVTGELRRFAAGDFTQRPVSTRDHAELGELIAAYNGATAQVASAFAERVRVEEQMRRFVADAGHELRTPLTVISGFVDVLEKGGADDPGIRERSFRTLREETRRMRRLVERLMALARLEQPEPAKPDAVGIAEIVRGAVAEVNAARRSAVEVDVDPLAERIDVLADRGELHEAVGNLVDNAVKYGAGSRVTVDVRGDEDDVLVRVRDGGPGIPETDRAHVFERFFRGDAVAGIEGSGLGLAIADRAVTRCGGSVHLESGEPGRTSFVLVLPAMRSEKPAETELRIG